MGRGRATVLRTLLVAHAAIPLVVLGSPAAAGAAGGLRTPPRYLGALVASLSSSDRMRLSLSSTDAGVAIVGLDAGSPAERARLGVGDLIVSADGRPIYSPRGLDAILRRHPPSSSLPLTVRRGQETHAVSVTLEELPRGDLGFEVAPLVDRPDIRAQMPRGSTAPDSLPVVVWAQRGVPGFAGAGFQSGVAIVAVNDDSVRSPRELRQRTEPLRVGDDITLRFVGDGTSRTVRYVAQSPARPWAGLRLEEMSPLLIEAESLSVTGADSGGLFIRRVEPGSPAEKAALRPGDRILSIAGEPLVTLEGFDRVYAGLRPGDQTNLRVARRQGGTEEVTLERAAQLGTLRARRERPGGLGFEIAPGTAGPGTLGANLFRPEVWLQPSVARRRMPPVPLPFYWSKVTGPRVKGTTELYWEAGRGADRTVAAAEPDASESAAPAPAPRAGFTLHLSQVDSRSDATLGARWAWDYGLADERWHHLVAVSGRAPWIPLVTYRDQPTPFYHEELSNTAEATASAMLWGEDHVRYIHTRGWTAGWRPTFERFPGHETELTLAFVRESPLRNAETSSLFGRDHFGPNPFAGVASGRLHATTLAYRYRRTRPRTWERVFVEGEVRAAGGALGGDRDFVRWEINVAPSFRLHRRLYLDQRLRAGLATGRLPLQESFDVGGKGTLPGFADARFSGDRSLLARTRLSLVPIGLPEQEVQLRLFAGFDAGHAWRRDERQGIPRLRQDLALGAGLFIGQGRAVFFPTSASVTWARPLDEAGDRIWRFQFDFFGGATR